MTSKFVRTTGSGVHGLCFHRKRPWILASMHSGVIEVWDFQRGLLIHRYPAGEHHGPVRSVHFHDFEPLFASGGDDCRVKTWSYEYQMCLHTFVGHNARVRTVQFHHEYPWIISASDDYTIRIWNWQLITCVSVVTGHKGSVKSAFFHPREDIILSASADCSVRLWDFSNLRKKYINRTNNGLQPNQFNQYISDDSDVYVTFDFRNHFRFGANWASFHPTRPCFVSTSSYLFVHQRTGADMWDWYGYRLGFDISCALFHLNFVVSTSEDKIIGIWNATCKYRLRALSPGNNTYWVLASHHEWNYVAAGHDNGFIVLKLDRERPDFSISGNSLLYSKDRFLRVFNYSTQEDLQLIPIGQKLCFEKTRRGSCSLSYNPAENAALISSNVGGDSYELYIVHKDSYGRPNIVQDGKRGTGGSVVFMGQSMFAVLEKRSNELLIKNFKNEIVKKSPLPILADAIFYAGMGTLLCRAEDRLLIIDPLRTIVLRSLKIPKIRYIVWSPDLEMVALLKKFSIVIADNMLEQRCIFHEKFSVKGGAWDDDGVFIYSTMTHIKYGLPNGESGIIKALNAPIYINKICGNTIFAFDQERKICSIMIDSTEYILKLLLLRKKYDQFLDMIKNSEFCLNSMVGYLLQKGLTEVALHCLKDKKTRFNSALECGNVGLAVAAEKIGEKDDWYMLGEEALLKGYTGIAEYSYQCTKNIGRLSFLYLVTGNLDKLTKLMKLSEVKNDLTAQLHSALLLGDIEEHVKILENADHLPLAYMTASVHGLHDIAKRLAAKLGDNFPCLPKGKSASLLIPPKPIVCGGDWPLLLFTKGIFEGNTRRPASLLNKKMEMETLRRRRPTCS